MFISSLPDLKQKAMVSLLYSGGLRISEVCHLKYQDIDRKHMRIHITQAKKCFDRYAILSKSALQILTDYWYAFDSYQHIHNNSCSHLPDCAYPPSTLTRCHENIDFIGFLFVFSCQHALGVINYSFVLRIILLYN